MNVQPSSRSEIKAARMFDTEVDELISEEDDARIDINDIDIWIDPVDATQVKKSKFVLRGMAFLRILCILSTRVDFPTATASRSTQRTCCST